MNNSYDAGLEYYNGLIDTPQRTLEAAKIAYYNQVNGRSDNSLEVAEMWFYLNGGDQPEPPDPDVAQVNNGDAVVIQTSTGASGGSGLAAVTDGSLTHIQLDASRYPIENNEAIVIGEATYTFTVEGGEITNIVVS